MNRKVWGTVIAILLGLVVGCGWSTLWFPVLAKTVYAIAGAILIPLAVWLYVMFFYGRKNPPQNDVTLLSLMVSRRMVFAFTLSWFIFALLSFASLVVLLLFALRGFT